MRAAIAAYVARLTGSRLRRNIFLIVRANAVTQAVLLLATPVLTRLYRPEDFGTAGLFAITAGLFLAVASLRFEWSIPSADSDEDARSLIAVALLTAATVSLLLFVLFTVPDQKALFALFGMEPIPFAPLVPLLSFANGAAAILSSAYIRSRTMETVSHSKYWHSGTQLAASLSAGVAGMAALGLALSYTISALAGAMTLARGMWRAMLAEFRDIPRQIGTAGRYLSRALVSTAVSLVNFSFANCMPLLLLTGYSVREVGFYFVAMRLAGAPSALLSSGIAASFWGEAAEYARTDPVLLRRLYLKIVRRLALLSIPIVLFCIAAHFFLPAILGSHDWGQIGLVLLACLPQIVAGFVFSSTTHLIVYGRQGYQLLSDLFSVAGSLSVFTLALAGKWPFALAILGISSVIFLAYVLRFLLHLRANTEWQARVRASASSVSG